MAVSSTLKIASISLGAGSVATGLGAHYFLSSSTIEQLLDEKYIILDIKDTADTTKHWEKAWGKYKEKNTTADANGKDTWKLKDWTGHNKANNISSEFRTKCREYRNKQIKDKKDPAYEEFVSFCTRVTNIEDQLKKDNLTPLGETGNEQKWQANVKKTEQLKSLGIDGPAQEQALKKKCTEVKTKDKDASDFNAVYEAFKQVCV